MESQNYPLFILFMLICMNTCKNLTNYDQASVYILISQESEFVALMLIIVFQVIPQELIYFNSVQLSSVTQSCPTLCDHMDCNTPGLPVHHQLPEFIQMHVHGVGDAIQPSHPLPSPSPPAFNLSQHQGLFKIPQELIYLVIHL